MTEQAGHSDNPGTTGPSTERTDPERDRQVAGHGDDISTEAATSADSSADSAGSDSGGQVSEVGSLGDGPQPISDGQSVAGQPDGESGEVDEGPQGPNARTGSDLPDGPQPDRDSVTGS